MAAVQLVKVGRNLEIRPIDAEALEDCETLVECLEAGGTSAPTGNGWEFLDPAEVGALTDGEILTDDAERDDAGRLIRCGRVYWHDRYQTDDAAAMLREGRTVTLSGHD